MLKKLCAFILFLTLAFCAGCSPSEPAPSPSSTNLDPIITSQGEGEQKSVNITYLPASIASDGVVLKWALLNYERVQLTEEVVLAFNEALREAGCGYQIQFIVVDGENEAVLQTYREKLAGEADLITSYGVTDQLIDEDVFLPLNDWVENGEGSFLNNVLAWEKEWLRASQNGVMYGIPTMTMYARGPAWMVNQKIIERYGFTEEDFEKEIWELADTFETIYEKEGKNPYMAYSFSVKGLGSTEENMLSFSGTLSYLPNYYELLTSTVGIDWRQEGAPLVNLYESEFLQKSVEAWQLYYQKGYLYDQNLNEEKVPHISPSTSYSTQVVQMEADGSYVIPIGQTYLSNEYLPSSFLAVSKRAPHQAEALAFIQKVFTDQELYNLLIFGIEGENYTLEDGVLTRNVEKPYSADYLLYGYEFAPFTLAENQFLSPARDGLTVKEAHRKDLEEAIFTPYAGIKWDFSKVETERQATEALAVKYAEEFGVHMKNGTALEQLKTFQAELKEAGIDALLAELNRQANEWKEAYPS